MTYSKPLISKDDFVSIINSLRDKEDMVMKINDIIREYRDTIQIDFIDGNGIIIGQEDEVVKLLELIMKDDECNNISWFIWEKDFGRDFDMGDFKDDGEDIDLSSADKLYDYLKRINFDECSEEV